MPANDLCRLVPIEPLGLNSCRKNGGMRGLHFDDHLRDLPTPMTEVDKRDCTMDSLPTP